MVTDLADVHSHPNAIQPLGFTRCFFPHFDRAIMQKKYFRAPRFSETTV